MGIRKTEWQELEEYFRRIAVKWSRVQHHLYNGREASSPYYQIWEARGSAEEFRHAWRKRFNFESIDLAEFFREESVLFRSRRALLRDSLKLSRGEITLFHDLSNQYGPDFSGRPQFDDDRFLDEADGIYARRSNLLIDHAGYALYVAWQPESLIVVPDNRLALIRALAVDPDSYVGISPRQFEELVAYVYETLGCKVEITQQSRDFGADILVWHPAPLGTQTLIAVQVKKYARHRRVGLKQIFELRCCYSLSCR